MSVLFDNVQVNIDPRSVTIGGSWEGGFEKPWSSELVKLCYDILPKDKQTTLVDIGANTGTFSLLPVCMPNLKIESFEPNPEVLEILKANIALNKITGQVSVWDTALAETQKDMEMKIPKNGESGFTCVGNPLRFNDYRTVQIRTMTLDDFTTFNNVDLIKIDTEGCEKFVLMGAKKIIEKFSPTLLVEYQPKNTAQFDYKVEELDELLLSYGYKGTIVSEEDKLYRRTL